jgi:cell wall-associated NlpC family hydrolase
LAAGPPVDPGTITAPNPAAATAVAAALTAVGRGGRYIPEGNGPVDFDCSGLTSYAWRAAGVHLVDYSYTQWDQTQRIPRSALAPGDLVFWFGGDVHHVAIVTAVNGAQVTIAEAANPTDGIRTRPLGGGWDDAYLSGFGRVVAA